MEVFSSWRCGSEWPHTSARHWQSQCPPFAVTKSQANFKKKRQWLVGWWFMLVVYHFRHNMTQPQAIMPCIRDLEDRPHWTSTICQQLNLIFFGNEKQKLLASAGSNGLLVVHWRTNDVSMVLTWHWANQTKLQAALANHWQRLSQSKL